MFNQYKLGDNSQTVTMNTPCTGMIQKSMPLSKFMRFHQRSKYADHIFCDNPSLDEYGKIKIIVLQIMVFGNNEILMEYILESDINKQK